MARLSEQKIGCITILLAPFHLLALSTICLYWFLFDRETLRHFAEGINDPRGI
jgi:hypothetical protein